MNFILIYFMFIMLLINYSFQDITFKILHTGDIHANYLERPCGPNRMCGAVDRLVPYIKQQRKKFKNAIYLDAGDMFTGSYHFGAIGWPLAADITNLLNPDVSCLGNHEFDLGPKNLSQYIKKTKKVLCCNCDYANDPDLKTGIEPSRILTIDKQKVGIIGYIAKNTRSDDGRFGNVLFTSEKEAIAAEVKKLTASGVKIIILLGHCGYEPDMKFAAEIPDVDIVVGGHSHTLLFHKPLAIAPSGPYPTNVTNKQNIIVPVVHAYQSAFTVGNVDVTFDSKGILKKFSGNLVEMNQEYKTDDSVSKILAKYKDILDKLKNTIVGKTTVNLHGDSNQCRRYECNVGNLITDAYIHHMAVKYKGDSWTDISIAFLNGGAIRNGHYDDETISMATLGNIIPFENIPARLEISGDVLMQVLNRSVSWGQTSKGEFLQFSGVRVVYDFGQVGMKRILSARVRCADCKVPKYEPVDKKKKYKVITTDFVSGGGDGYEMLKGATRLGEEDITDVDLLANYIRFHRTVAPKLDQRIIVLHDKMRKSGAIMNRTNFNSVLIFVLTIPLTCKLCNKIILTDEIY